MVDNGLGVWPANYVSIPASNLSYQATGLTGGLTYGFKIKAQNDIGISEESDTQFFVCADLPQAPLAPVFEQATHTSITIAWNPPGSNGGSTITGYRVQMNAVDQGDWNMIYDGTSQPTKLFLKQIGLKSGGLYRFRVSAINSVGEGPYSVDATFLCAATASAVSQPFVVS